MATKKPAQLKRGKTNQTNRTPKREPKRGRGGRFRDWRPAFLAELAQTANVSAACLKANIGRAAAYEARKTGDGAKEFAAAWDDALETACDLLELEARRRAVNGTDEPVFYKGMRCGAVRRYSDTLLIVLLKAHRPNKYRERISVSNLPELDEANMRLLTDEEVEQAAAGKFTAEQLSMIIATRQAKG